jgi:hypothetical protein
VRGEAVPGAAASTGATLATDGAPVEDHEITGRNASDPRTDRLDHTGRFMAEQVRVIVADAAFAVVQIRMTHTARLHSNQRLAGTGVGHDHRLDRDWFTLCAGNDTANLMCHRPGRLTRQRS